MASPKAPGIVQLFTDGACSGNPGPGGWAALLRYGDHEKILSGGEGKTTNNRMELMAVISGLKALRRPVSIRITTDSKYVLDGATQWLKGWKDKNWNRHKAPENQVKNQDLWQELDQLLQKHHVQWQWVRGHQGHPENEKVDQLARAEISKLRSL